MIWLLCFVLAALTSPFKSKIRLEAENAALRHQLIVLRRKLRGRVKLANSDRWFFIQLYRWFPSILKVLTVIRPETLVRWHRAGFRSYWRWKSRSLGGRPQIETDLRALIRQMSIENSLWGAPRIHGELLKLARISHSVRRIGTPNQRKFFCEKGFSMIRGAPRCRQSVAQNSLILEWWKAAPSKRRWARTHSGLASSALARPRSVRTTCAAVSAGFHVNV
jgi:hypothetical protein